ncbi:ISL3 family transposase [Crateriforma conspicua]|uniref:Transposase n=1 Tax=Crateriforma conspicua TaxID=2527996 RepID=A0A5C5Y2C7_9PLAN|nr:ISL3 family transposase [Crateriforma conspicua]QDV61088.1 Transposase [Crateriforma conspicua]QDV63768.1 Transposase [Crateriforma conspicua]TWT69148.1 Transposase [Crateriforma conspicua]
MQETEFYQQILGLKQPWFVADVKLDPEAQQVDVYVEHPEGTSFCCPECGKACSVYDHTKSRRWRHLDTMHFRTVLHAQPPRVNCPEHGVRQATLPWAEKSSRFTIFFERFAIDVLLATQTVQGAQGILKTSWDETWHILKRAVARGQARKSAKPMPRIGIDEKAFRKGQNYITLIYDLDRSTVEAISDGNDTESGNACFSQLSQEQRDSVEAIAMDMSAAFVRSAKQNIPMAEHKIVHDRFHIMKLASEAVDKVRRGEHRQLKSQGDDRLTGTRYLWLSGQENLTDAQRERFDRVYKQELETGKAWAYKEMLRDLWHHEDAGSATLFFQDWYRRVIHTKLTPLKKVARTIKERLANVVSYCVHGITNAVAEGINSKIMSIKRRVGGYRNRENFKTAIYFYCGGLDLCPQ